MDGDGDGDWNATTFFSPSKARAHQAQAKDWAVVDAWLSKRYASKRLPTFERNEETLHALLTLANANETADEQRGYIDRIDKAALAATAKRAASNDKVYQLILDGTSNVSDLESLAESVVALDCPASDVSEMAAAISNLTTNLFLLQEEVRRTQTQIDIIKVEKARLKQMAGQLEDDAFTVPSKSAERVADWYRESKHMRAKLQEYDERLSAIGSVESSSAHLDNVVQQKKALAADSEELADLHTQLASFQSLPADGKAAQVRIQSARKELLALVKKRDALFEQLADGA